VGSQTPDFQIDSESVSISPRDAGRLVESLRARPDSSSAADKIDRATNLGEPTTVKLSIGEDEEVLAGLAELRTSGDFSSALQRLERAIQAKIDREG